MSALNRRASPPLMARPSPYHASVTLIEHADLEEIASSSTPRRSKRIRVGEDAMTPSSGETTSHVSTSVKVEDAGDSDVVHLKATKRTRTVKRETTSSPRKVKLIPQALDVPHPAPQNWREAYDTIKEMRSNIVAPVDTMGCDRAQLEEMEPQVRQYSEDPAELAYQHVILNFTYDIYRISALPPSFP